MPRELAADHTLVLFGNMARPWVETVLTEHGVLDCFDEIVVSSDLRRPKPHPDGCVECLPQGDKPVAFVSDEYNEDLLMGETFGTTSVWVESDGKTPYREPDVRVSTLADVPDVLAMDGHTVRTASRPQSPDHPTLTLCRTRSLHHPRGSTG